MAKKKSGLGLDEMVGAGKNALFKVNLSPQTKEVEPETPEPAETPEPEKAQPEPVQQKTDQPAEQPIKHKKVRTTVTLYTDTFALLEALKVYSRKHGMKATYSDILDAAIRDLAEKHDVQA